MHSRLWCLSLTDRHNLEALGVSSRRVLQHIFKNKRGKRGVYYSSSEWGTILNKVMRFQVLHKAENFLINWGLAITSRMTLLVGFMLVKTEDLKTLGPLILRLIV